MAKVLVAFRLPENVRNNLKKLSSDYKVSQSEIVVEGIALYQMKMLYKQSTLVQEKDGCYTQVEEKKGGFCE